MTLYQPGWFSSISSQWYLMKARVKTDIEKPNTMGVTGILYNGVPPGETDLNGEGLISVGTTWTLIRNFQESYGGTQSMLPQLTIKNNSKSPVNVYIDSVEIKEISPPSE